jgi:lipoprotein-anchoring transpeptidase ErfK/SrfK
MTKSPLRALFLGAAAGMALLSGCTTTETTSTNGTFPGNYTTVAYKAKDPSAIRVKVSLENRMVYVMEGSQPLLVTPVTIGTNGKGTPLGSYRVTNKELNKRSGSYGFWVKGNEIVAGESGRAPGGGYHYVGYPMPYWVQFKPEYGFHAGAVWPTAHSHGCIRIHPNVAPKFFALVHEGTPVTIQTSLPEDATVGKSVARPNDYAWKDKSAALLISGPSSHAFSSPQEPLLVTQ